MIISHSYEHNTLLFSENLMHLYKIYAIYINLYQKQNKKRCIDTIYRINRTLDCVGYYIF